MKEIGATLKDAREEIGITIEEAANDLKIRPSQIENIETGNIDAFKDVYYMKCFIKSYAKYLGLNYEDLMDEFNEYLFDYTSRISIEDIRKAKKKINKKQAKAERKIVSPYTLDRKSKFPIPPFLIYILLIIIVFVISYFIFSRITKDKPSDTIEDVIVYKEEA